jgi:hypothetical protein
MPYDDAPPSFADLASQVQAGSFTTTPPAALTPASGQSDAPPSMPYDQQYGITRNTDGSIYGFPSGVTAILGGPDATPAQQQGVTAPDTNPDRIQQFLANHPEDIANQPVQPPAPQPNPDQPQPGNASGPSTSPDDVQKLLAGGYSLTPGGPVAGTVDATPSLTPGQQAAQAVVDKTVAQIPDWQRQNINEPIFDFLHAATFGGSDALAAAGDYASTAVKNAMMRAQGQTPPYSAADAYGASHQAYLDQEAQFRADHPKTDLALNIGGALATPLPLAGVIGGGVKAASGLSKLPMLGETAARALTSTSGFARTGRAALVGGGLGATGGLLDSNSPAQILPNATSGGAFGVGGGALGEAGGAALSRGISTVLARTLPQKVTQAALDQAGGAFRGMGIDPGQLPQKASADLGTMIRGGAHPADAAIITAAQSLPQKVRLSRSQITGDAGQQWTEAQFAKGARGQGAEMVAKGFKADQQQAIRQNAESIGSQLGGGRPMQPGQGGTMASDALNTARDTKQAAVRSAYDAAENAANPALLHTYDAKAVTGAIRQSVANYDPLRVPAVTRELGRLDTLAPTRGGIDARELFQARSRLTNLRASNDGVEASAAREAVKAFDTQIEHAVTDGLMHGDPATVGLWRKAIGERREFGHLFQGGDLVERLTEREPRSGRMQLAVDPHDASNVILGRSALGFVGRQNLYRDLNVIKDRLGPGSAAWNGIRGEIFQRLANASGRTVDGQSQLDGVQFQRLWQDLRRDDPQLVKSLYSEEEQALIDRFAGVAAKVTKNPSSLGMIGMGGSVRQTLGRLPFSTIEGIPLIGHMADKIDHFVAQRAAMRSTVRSGPRTTLPTRPAPSYGTQGAALSQLPLRKP